MASVEMTEEGRRILADALGLSDQDRAAMASELIESLDPSPLGLDEHWRLELKRRVAAYEAGEAKTFAVEEVFEEIDREFGWK